MANNLNFMPKATDASGGGVSGRGGYGAVPEQHGLLRVLSNDQIEAKEKSDRAAADRMQNKPEIISLANHVRHHWEAAKNTKWFVEERLLKCLRQRKGKYDPDDYRNIKKFGGSQIFMMITNAKCRAIESWIRDILLPAGEKPWSITPTPDVDIDDDVMDKIQAQVVEETMMVAQYFGPEKITPEMIDIRQEQLRRAYEQEATALANKEAKRIEKRINDHFTEGDFYREMAMFVKDFATYPTAFLKGPIVRRTKRLEWEEGMGGNKQPKLKWKYIRTWKRVNPFDIYTSPGSRNIQDSYIIERKRYRQHDLVKMKGVPGFDKDSIDQVLMEYSHGQLQDWLWTDQERANLEWRPNEQEDPDAIIECLEYHGDIPGHMLIDWGVDSKKIKNPAEPVPAVVSLIGRWVIMARINEDPFGEKPYYAASFDSSPDSIWGLAPPEIMEDCQRACNAVARALINNAAMASGPQVEVHRDRLDAGENPQKIYPWKIWKTKSDPIGHNRQAVHFYQPDPMAKMLMDVYQYFFTQAGEQLGIPAYEQGLGGAASGAGKTAHGLSMLMNAASKILKDAILTIDMDVIKKVVYNTWIHTVMYDKDIDYRGDINIVARASEHLIAAEQLQARRNEYLAMTANPIDMQIIGLDGRAKILRETTKSLKLGDDIIPTDQDLDTKIQAAMAQQQQANMAGVSGPMGGPPGAVESPEATTAAGEARRGGEYENPVLAPIEPPTTMKMAAM